MVKCSFCGELIALGTDRMHIQIDGRIFHFCGSKCRKNMLQLQRKPTKTKWSQYYKP